MRHAGGWVLGITAVLGMAAAAVLGLRPLLFRRLIVIEFLETNGNRWKPVQETGVRLAFGEHGFRAGPHRIEPQFINIPGNPRQDSHLLTVEHSSGYWALLHPFIERSTPSAFPDRLEIAPHLDSLGAQTARWTKGQGIVRVFMPAYLGSARGFEGGFLAQAGPAGIVCLSDRSEPQGRSLVDWVLAGTPELVILGSNAPAIVDALRDGGFQGRFLLIDPAPSLEPKSNAVSAFEGSFVVSRYAPIPVEFAAKFQAGGAGQPTADDYLGYLTANLILDAVDRTGTTDPAALYRSIAQSPEFTPSGGISSLPGSLYAVKNGKFEFVELLK
jgi:hypothetical protein